MQSVKSQNCRLVQMMNRAVFMTSHGHNDSAGRLILFVAKYRQKS